MLPLRLALPLFLAAALPAQNVLVCDQPALSLRPGESTCVTVRTVPATPGVPIQPSFQASFVGVSPASATPTGATGSVRFTVSSAAVHLLGTNVSFTNPGGTFAPAACHVVCDQHKLTLQGTAGSYPGAFALEVVADPPANPAVFAAIFLSPSFGVVPLNLFNPADPRVLSLGPAGLVLPPTFAQPFFPPFEKFSAPALTIGPLPGNAKIYVQGATISFSGTGLFERITQPQPVYLAPADAFSTRNRQMSTVRSFFPVIETADQRALAIGGGAGAIFAQVATDVCDVYDPVTDTWSQNAASMTAPRSLHTATRLPSGRYLIVGGVDDVNDPLSSAEIYDPASNTFTAVGSMATPRVGHSATLLPSGQVLIAGGLSVIGAAGISGIVTTITSAVASTEIFTPDASGCGGTFAPGPTMTRPRAGHAVVPLADGRFYFMGGVGWTVLVVKIPAIWAETEFYTGTGFTPGPAMPTARALGSVARTGSAPDRFLLAGGLNSVLGAGAPTDRADLYTASPNQPGSWSRAGNLSSPRAMQAAFRFGDEVIQIGGLKGDLVTPESQATTDVYHIPSGTWSAGPTMTTERGAYGSYVDPYGVVHILGGAAGPGPSPAVSNSTEWYYR